MTPQGLTPDDVVAAAATVEAALRPVAASGPGDSWQGLLSASGRPAGPARG